MSEVIVYKCPVCPFSTTNMHSYSAHMRCHKDVTFEQLNMRLPKDQRDWYLEYCRRHNTTTCHLMLALITALQSGEKTGVVTLGSPNPTIITLKQVFAARPHGRGKYDLSSLAETGELPNVRCNFYGGVRPGEVYCKWRGLFSWVPWHRCKTCEKNMARLPSPVQNDASAQSTTTLRT